MWISCDYVATSLFSLKPASATASGGKTLLVPTPFAVKMALLDVACRTQGVESAQIDWEWLCNLTVALHPAERVVVNNTFIKVLKPRRDNAKGKNKSAEDMEGEGGDEGEESQGGRADAGFFQRTITYREYAQLEGVFRIALGGTSDLNPSKLSDWLLRLNYLGKRGSFIQAIDEPTRFESVLPPEFVLMDGQVGAVGLQGLLTQVDDTARNLPFERVDIYSSKALKLGKDRLLRNVWLPYERVASSRNYTQYQRINSV